jgi:hypothetical protein
MSGRSLSEPAFAEVHQSHSVAMDDGFRCRHCRNSIWLGIAPISVAWTGSERSLFDNFHRSSSTLLLQFVASPHTKDLTNR